MGQPVPDRLLTADAGHVRTPWHGVFAVFSAGVCAAFALLKVSAAGPALRAALGLDLPRFGLLMSVCTLATAALALPAGAWVRRVGGRRVLLVGLGLLALGSVAGALAHSAGLVAAARAVEGLGFVLVTVAGPALVAALAAPAQRAAALALWAVWLPVGGLAAFALAPLLPGDGWPGLWWVGAGAGVAAAAWVSVQSDPPAMAAAPQVGSEEGRARRVGLALAALFCCFTFQLYAVLTFLPTVLVELHGHSPGVASRAAALTLIGSASAGALAGRAMHRGVPPRAVVLAGFAVLAILVPALALAVHAPAAGAALLLLHGLVGGSVATAIYAWAPLRTLPAHLGPTMGWIMTGNAAGILLGPPVVGGLVEAGASWLQAAVMPALVAGVGAAAAFRLGRTDPEAAGG